jgi:hypothetical protein
LKASHENNPVNLGRYDQRAKRPAGDIQIGSDADHSMLVTGSENVVIQAENVMLHAVQQASLSQSDPARMLRVLADGVRRSGAPILLARLTMPTLDALRYALSPRAWVQGVSSRMFSTSAAMPGGRVCSWRTSWARCTLPLPRKS